MRTKRIVYVIDNMLRAGTQTALLYLIEGLSERAYAQQVICLNRRFDLDLVESFEQLGIEVVVFGKEKFFKPSGLRLLYRAFREADIVQTFLPFSDVVGRLFGKLAGVPTIVTSIRARNTDKQAWQLLLDRLTMGWADRVVFNAANVVDFSCQFEGVQPEQVVVIPNGVRFRAPDMHGRSILTGIVPDDAIVIGTVGRLRPQKGIDVLLNAFAKLESKKAHLVLVGDGELRESLISLTEALGIHERTHFLGTRSDLPALYAAFDVYAHAARFEGMPNAVMEAMSAGLPVVATAADGTRELIENDRTGWLVPVDDAEALGEKLGYVLENPEFVRSVGAEAAAFMREKYSVQKMVDGFDNLYKELVNLADQV